MSQAKPLLLPANDYVFKKLFSTNKRALADFLRSILDFSEDEDLADEDFEDLNVVNPILEGEAITDKTCILDILVRTRSGNPLDIEMQLCNHIGLWERIQLYSTRLYARQAQRGERYDALRRSINIFIVGFPFVDNDGYPISSFRFFDRRLRNVEFPNSMEIDIVELAKLENAADGDMKDWLCFLASKKEEDIMQIASQNKQINNALFTLEDISMNENERRIAEAREDMIRTMNQMFHDGKEQGRKEEHAIMQLKLDDEKRKLDDEKRKLDDEKRKIIDEKKQSVIRMYKDKMDISLISQYLGLAESDVYNVVKSL